MRGETHVEATERCLPCSGLFVYPLPGLLDNQVFLIMRNPFRKVSPEEEFVAEFLKGMKESPNFTQDTKHIYDLIKIHFDSGDYVAAQNAVNDYMQIMTANFRAEK